jgi:peptidoglycan/xylan/chitin deacetylase (PgdA/CDA1 family)
MTPWKAACLNAYYYASHPLRRHLARKAAAAGHMPVVVLFYHRIGDDRATPETTTNGEFRQQIRWLRKHCDLVSLAEVQQRIRAGVNRRPCVSITFDDGYAENCDQAIPLLIEERIPCTYFVTLENIRDGRPFAHDMVHGNSFPPNTLEQLRTMIAGGIEIGAHGYSHADLGTITNRNQLEHEVVAAGDELAQMLGRPVRYFAFPYGRLDNLNPAAFAIARAAGYEAMCSAYGGYNWPGGDAFHFRRVHGDQDTIHLKNWITLDPRKLLADARRLREEPLWADGERHEEMAPNPCDTVIDHVAMSVRQFCSPENVALAPVTNIGRGR